MFHIQAFEPKTEFGTSGFLRDANGNPVIFETEEEALQLIADTRMEGVKVVEVDEPVDVHNPGGMPQVGSARNFATPGKQVHTVALEFPKAKSVRAVQPEAADKAVAAGKKIEAAGYAALHKAEGKPIDAPESDPSKEKKDDLEEAADVVGADVDLEEEEVVDEKTGEKKKTGRKVPKKKK